VSGSVLLDTNIVIGLFANDQAILARLSETDHIFIPSIVLGELYFGAYKSTHTELNIRRIEEFVTTGAVLREIERCQEPFHVSHYLIQCSARSTVRTAIG
jgi:predicted nucleic acid-binding protein